MRMNVNKNCTFITILLQRCQPQAMNKRCTSRKIGRGKHCGSKRKLLGIIEVPPFFQETFGN
jgi:hypothetical protein